MGISLIHSCAPEITWRGIWLPSLRTTNRFTCSKGLLSFFLFALLFVLLLSLESDQSIRLLQIHFAEVVFGQHLHQTRKFLLQTGHVVVAQLLRPILLALPKRGRVEFVQTSGLNVAVTAKTVEALPIFPPGLPKQMVRIHATGPVAQMSDLILLGPSVFILFGSWRVRIRFEDLDRHLMSAKTRRAIGTFFTVIRMRKNAAVVEDEEALFTHSVEGVSVLGVAGGSLGLDLERPVQEDSVVLDHLAAHFCDSSSR